MNRSRKKIVIKTVNENNIFKKIIMEKKISLRFNG